MYVIDELEKKYGRQVQKWKILLLNAGGQSQRLPNASVLGKLFMPWPIDTGHSPTYDTMDIKLANYLPFLSKMLPGYFHAASDTVEVFDLGSDLEWTFEKPGFTALAHPSSLKIGTGHGVYVVQENNKTGSVAEILQCFEVLQKPSIERMKERGAVMTNAKGNEPWVYTDSCFFFDHQVADKLMTFYRENSPFDCEIDGYGDFLQALGPRATIDYTRDVANVSKVEPKLVQIREKIFHLLKGTPLHVLVMDESKFYHVGTMNEYIYHYCLDHTLANELGFKAKGSGQNVNEPPAKVARQEGGAILGCVMHCMLPKGIIVPESSILEYCDLDGQVTVGANSILSNCVYHGSTRIMVPENTFMHTIAVKQDDVIKYVTVLFSVKDNIKQQKSHEHAENLMFMQQQLTVAGKLFKIDISKDVFANCCDDTESVYSLWNAKLFPVLGSMSESFKLAIKMLQCLTTEKGTLNLQQYVLLSMKDILERKDVNTMLKFRESMHGKSPNHG